MYDISEVIDNINNIYNNSTSLDILKDYERVFDELDTYVFENWEDGELVRGPIVDRHWITCDFMWPYEKMPNPEAAKRLSEYGCQVVYKKDQLITPRKINSPDDFRPGSKKGKLDETPIWIVEIQMPKKLILDVFRGYHNKLESEIEQTLPEEPTQIAVPQSEEQSMSLSAEPQAPQAPQAPATPQF